MKFTDASGNVKFGKALFFGNNIQMSEQQDGIVTINAAILSGTGAKLSLLGDVQITSLQDDQFLRWNAGTSFWVNQFLTAADIGAGIFKAGNFTFQNQVLLPAGTIATPSLVDSVTTKTGLTFSNPGELDIIISGTPIVIFPAAFNSRIVFNKSFDVFHGSGIAAPNIISLNPYGPSGGSGWQARVDSGAAVTAGSRLGFYTFGGALDANHTLVNSASLEGFASGTWTGTSSPSYISFLITPPNTTSRSEMARVVQNGILEIVGTSSTFAQKGKNVFVDMTQHNYSGTTEASYTSYLLKANSLFNTGDSIRIKAYLQTNGTASAFVVKIGGSVIMSGTICPQTYTLFDGLMFKTGSGQLFTEWTFTSGTSSFTGGGVAPITTFQGNVPFVTVNLAQDQLIDFRGNNYVATPLNTVLYVAEIIVNST